MSTKRSDALQALVGEIADLDAELVQARAAEDEARTEATAARQALDQLAGKRTALEDRQEATRQALRIIQGRDEISDDVVTALLARARR